MTKHKHQRSTIEINGKVYDTHTGREINGSSKLPPKAKPIDGVIGRVPIQSQPMSPPQPVQPARQHADKPTETRPEPKHLKRQKTRSQTLMRSGLKKPTLNPDIQRTPADEYVLQNNLAKRAERARQIQKSRLVRRFNPQAQPEPTISRKHQPLAVAEPKEPRQIPKQPAPYHHSAKANQAAKPAQNSIKDFEQAIHNATSHLEKMPKKSKKSRLKPKASKTNVAMASIAAVLLMGFFAWQNTPNLQMRLAASRANIPASLPGYSPAGYSAGEISSEPGKVSVSFSSRTDERAFTITEQASEWNSDALYANYVEPRNGQIYESGEKKLYLVDGSNATWVENGIWYRIEGSSDLTTDQLGRIANSL